MIIEKTLERLGLVLPDLEQLYRTNPSGAKFVSHVAVQNVLYLSGTVPLKDGKPFRQGFLGKDLTVADGQEAARYAALVRGMAARRSERGAGAAAPPRIIESGAPPPRGARRARPASPGRRPHDWPGIVRATAPRRSP